MSRAVERARAFFATLPVTERKVLVYTAFAAGIFLLLPGEWVSGSLTLFITWVLYRLNIDLFPKKTKSKTDPAS